MPWLRLGIAFGRTALEIDREGEQAMLPPFGHGVEKLTRVALRVPVACVGISPAVDGIGVAIMKGSLDHTRVHEQALDFLSVPGAPLIRGLAVDVELVAHDGDDGLSRGSGVDGHDDDQQKKNAKRVCHDATIVTWPGLCHRKGKRIGQKNLQLLADFVSALPKLNERRRKSKRRNYDTTQLRTAFWTWRRFSA